jgi:hypothetical protein
MPRITSVRAQLYKNIISTNRPGFVYFWATFQGEGFSPYYKDRSFVYRRPANAPPLADEFKEKFANATIVSQPPPSEPAQGMQISLLQLEISSDEEAQDELAFPPYEMSRYLAEFQRRNNATVFRVDVAGEVGSTQMFIFTTDPFPGRTRRVPVDQDRIRVRKLRAVKAAAIEIARLSHQLKSELYWFVHPSAGDTQFPGRLEACLADLIKRCQNGSIAGYIATFLDAEFLKAHPGSTNAVSHFRNALEVQARLLLDVAWHANNPPNAAKAPESIATAVTNLTKTVFEALAVGKKKLEPLGIKFVRR